jgi:predicted metal-dependent HD superfamily phosphohydrolase
MFRGEWIRLCSSARIGPRATAEWAERLEACYAEPQRAYHTARHIEEMLQLVEVHRDRFSDPVVVTLATYFHE